MTREQAIKEIKTYIECLDASDSFCDKFENCIGCPYYTGMSITGKTFMTQLLDMLEENENDSISTMSM